MVRIGRHATFTTQPLHQSSIENKSKKQFLCNFLWRQTEKKIISHVLWVSSVSRAECHLLLNAECRLTVYTRWTHSVCLNRIQIRRINRKKLLKYLWFCQSGSLVSCLVFWLSINNLAYHQEWNIISFFQSKMRIDEKNLIVKECSLLMRMNFSRWQEMEFFVRILSTEKKYVTNREHHHCHEIVMMW